MRWHWWGRDKNSATIGLLFILLTVSICLRATLIRADSLRFRADLEATLTDVEVTDKATGDRIDSDVTFTNQQYNLDFTKNLFPNLTLLGGALYELTNIDTTTDGQDSENDETFLRPFIRLDLNTDLYRAGAEYRHTRIDSDFDDDLSITDKRDEFDTFFGYSPAGLPEFTARYNQIHSYNDAGTRDFMEKTWQLESAYNPIDTLRLFYFYQHDLDEDRNRDQEVANQRHTGRIDYARQFLDDRVAVNTGYQIDYNLQELPSEGVADTEITPTAGLFSFESDPQNPVTALAVNNALIDGLLTVPTTINIGLGGDQVNDTSIGLDLGLPTDINRILLWVDRRLTPSIAGSFVWSVYTSPDNLDTSTWTQVVNVAPAEFGTFENRFEIVFPTVTTRFIKIVTSALSPAFPGSASFPNIFVTEIEPFQRISGVQVTNDLKTVDHNYNLTVTGSLSPRTVVGYDLFYRLRRQDLPFQDDTDERSELSNGMFLRHTFNPVFSTNARVLRSDTEVNEDKIVDYNYSASLRAQYIDTFNQTLTFSGVRSELDEGTNSNNSVFLRNNAILYRGWSAFLDLGYTWEDTISVGEDTTTEVRFGTNVQPHRTLTLTLDSRWRSTNFKSSEFEDFSEIDYNLQAFYVPFPSLSLFGRITVRDREDRRDTVQNYSVNWSPFPDGDLQLSLAYSEILQSESDRRDRTYGPVISWNISRHLFLEAQYTISDSETEIQKIDTNTLRTEFRFIW
jgi:hypothetical protein